MSQNHIKMRTRNLIIVALLLLCTQTLWSQKIDQHLDMDNMSFFKEATMVVEGHFLKSTHTYVYVVEDIQGKEHYYGIWKVIAHKVFKGDAKVGDTIYVVREGTSWKNAKYSIYEFFYEFDAATGGYKYVDMDVDYDYSYLPIVRSKHIFVDVENKEYRDDCVLFFKESSFPKSKEEPYASLPQYQYLYPWVFYDEGTKMSLDGGKFGGLNDTIFNSRNDLYRFMLEAGGYDTSVVKISEPKDPEDSAPQSLYPMIEIGPPNRDSDNSPKASCYPDKPLPPEIEKRWGKESQKKNTSDQR